MKNGDFLRRPTTMYDPLKLTDGLALGKNELQSGMISLPAYRAFYLESLVKENGHIPFSRDSLFKTIVRDLQSSETVRYEPPAEQEGSARISERPVCLDEDVGRLPVRQDPCRRHGPGKNASDDNPAGSGKEERACGTAAGMAQQIGFPVVVASPDL